MELDRVGAVVLAAGASERFGGVKALASLDGRPLLQHVLDTARASGLRDVVVVLGNAAEQIERTIVWQGERIVRNPRPEAGLSGSLRLGFEALGADVMAAFVLLGDQPLVRPAVLEALLVAFSEEGRTVLVPRYAQGGGPNPVLIGRAAWPLVFEAVGDRGLGPLLRRHPELVLEVPVAGANPDIDTPADLAALESADRVRVGLPSEVSDDPHANAP